MISTGSMTGMRNRSCGKNTRPTRIDDAAEEEQRYRPARAPPQPPRAGDGERQHEQIRRDRRDTVSGGVYRIRGSDRNDAVESLARDEPHPGDRDAARSSRWPRGSRSARAASGETPGCDCRNASSALLSSGLAARSPSPRASGWFPVQNVTPPSEAIRTKRSWTRRLRRVHGVMTAAAASASATASARRLPSTSQATASGRNSNIAGRMSAAPPASTPAVAARTTARLGVRPPPGARDRPPAEVTKRRANATPL